MLQIDWTPERLAQLRIKGGVRLRGEQMNRLETFTDAAFAFAVTLLVISVDDVPNSFAEFQAALEGVPAFVMCFVQLMVFWWGHHVWSRRYGLEEGWDIVLSLSLVAIVLVYIYPLRIIFTAFVANVSSGSLGESFVTPSQLGEMFVTFGLFFGLLAGMLVLHFVRAYLLREQLALNAREIVETRGDIASWSVVSLTGFVSMSLAIVLPDMLKPSAAYTYYSLTLTMPCVGFWLARQRQRLAPPA
jgi:uncharacterized membrane protein